MDYLFDVAQIVFADIILSGDNALVIGMAAASLSPLLRRRAIMLGMAFAAGLRIFFAAIATYLLAIPGILFFGGALLLIVCWRFYKELKGEDLPQYNPDGEGSKSGNTLWSALITITIADVSMSIDNVVAVAAIAREDTGLLVMGLVLAIAFMAFFATIIMRVMTKFPLLAWAGLVFLVYLSGAMLFDGWPEVAMLIGL